METFIGVMNIITILTSVATLVALIFTIQQARLAKEALLETRKVLTKTRLIAN